MSNKEKWPPESGAVIHVTHLIERLDALEERENVRFEALSARIEVPNVEPYLSVFGEIHPSNGLEIAYELKVVVNAYDPQGRLLDIGWCPVDPKKFYGFQAFEIVTKLSGPITKIRLYPQKR